MNNTNKLIAVIVFVIGAVVAYQMLGDSHNASQMDANMQPESAHMHEMPDGSMMSDLESDMNHMMDMTAGSEREFILGMIPHHQEAIDTAKEVLARGGTTEEIKQLAEDIVVAQEKEIAEMKEWYQDWYGESYTDNGDYVPMMRELQNLSGTEIDKAFLEDMIRHHMGAIMMSQSVLPHIVHNEMKVLTEAIISTQAAEIQQMRKILEDL